MGGPGGRGGSKLYPLAGPVGMGAGARGGPRGRHGRGAGRRGPGGAGAAEGEPGAGRGRGGARRGADGGGGSRLESIRAVHESESRKPTTRTEDYLEVIAELVELKGYATTLDISRHMGVSAPSVTRMLQRLDENGHLEYEKYHGIRLTAAGARLAEAVRQKHGILLEFLEVLGVARDAADRDAEGIEHHLDEKTTRQLRKFTTYLRSHPDVLAEFRRL